MQTLNTLIPAERLTVVENALLQAFRTTEVQNIVLLAGGLSASAVYKITIDKRYYVLKLDNPADYSNSDTPTCMEIAAKAGIAPTVFHLNKKEGIVITGFVENLPLNSVFKTPDSLLTEVAKTISAIHGLPLFNKENNLADTVDGLISQFRVSGMLAGPVVDKCFEYYNVITKYYPWHDVDKVSSHNDLNPNNMICDGKKIWVIDWNAAFKNDRYVDLAIVANFYITTDEQESIFLKAYFGDSLNDYHSARFFIMRQICRLVYAILMFKLADSSKPIGAMHNADMQNADLHKVKEQLGNGSLSLAAYTGQLLFGKALLNEAVKSMQLPRFAASIEQIQHVEI